jgi:hypothetical protein
MIENLWPLLYWPVSQPVAHPTTNKEKLGGGNE